MWNFGKFKDSVAIITEQGEKITYAKLNEYCNNLTKHIKSRCLVFHLCSNEIGSLVGYVGFLQAKIVPLMLRADLDIALLKNMIDIYLPKYVNVPNSMAEKLPYLQKVYSNLNYTLLKTDFDKSYQLHDELALLLTTSGSTGSPKLVRQSYKNLTENTKSIVQYLKLDDTERAITSLPMNYNYGISIINTHFWVGASLILTDKSVMQKEFWQHLKDFEATSFAGVPYTYEMLDKLRFFNMKLPNLRYMTQAGGKLLPDLHHKFAKWAKDNNKKFIVMYGATEATARMGYLPAEKSLEKYGSMGIAIPNGKFSLIDTNGNVITTPQSVGELVYEGDNVCLGYAECGEDLCKDDEFGGKLFTGDMAEFDNEGFYYIVGRKKRFLKIYGNRISLDETERLIKAEFPSLECACAGTDKMMVIYTTDSAENENIIEFISTKTGLNKAAFEVKNVNEIPKNASGKTLYDELKDI